VDILSAEFDIVASNRWCQRGSYRVRTEGAETKICFHLLPSGILYPHVQCVIGNGVVLHIETMFEELESLKAAGHDVEDRLKISDRVAILFDYHKLMDGAQEDSKGTHKVGTTRRGIGPAYSDKINRRGLRLCDLKDWDKFVERYKANLAWHQDVFGFDYLPEGELALLHQYRERLLKMMVDGAL
jgi:adenylosuccinate synthase